MTPRRLTRWSALFLLLIATLSLFSLIQQPKTALGQSELTSCAVEGPRLVSVRLLNNLGPMLAIKVAVRARVRVTTYYNLGYERGSRQRVFMYGPTSVLFKYMSPGEERSLKVSIRIDEGETYECEVQLADRIPAVTHFPRVIFPSTGCTVKPVVVGLGVVSRFDGTLTLETQETAFRYVVVNAMVGGRLAGAPRPSPDPNTEVSFSTGSLRSRENRTYRINFPPGHWDLGAVTKIPIGCVPEVSDFEPKL